MNLFQELRQRRVPQIVSAYLVAGWGAIQFLEFLESRMAVSPNLVNLVGLALLLLLPTVVTMAWIHGRPGRDSWGSVPKVVLPANLVAVAVLLVFLFNGRDLGAVTETIEVLDENGTITERVIPKSEYRRRLLIFYPENAGLPEDDWAREMVAVLLAMDISQDVFVDVVVPASMATVFSNADLEGGHVSSRALQRKIARESHRPFFMTSTIAHQDGVWTLTTVLHESKSGQEAARRTIESNDLFTLADIASRQVRQDLGIPSAHLEASQDLPVAEMLSTDLEAVKSHVRGLVLAVHYNDWAGAAEEIEDAVTRDPDFSMAQFLRFAINQTLGQNEKASLAINAAMKSLYRLPERSGFLVKYQYYYGEKQEADKAMAVLQMWSQLYPNDIEPHLHMATYYTIRQDLPKTVVAYERALDIDPSQVHLFERLASLHNQMGHFEQAESYLQHYVDLFPTDTEGYEDLAAFYSLNGHLQQARDVLNKAQLVDPEKLDLTLRLIDLDTKLGQYAECQLVLDALLANEKNTRDRSQILARQLALARLQGKADELSRVMELYYSALSEIRNPMQVDLTFSMMWPVVSEAGNPQLALERIQQLGTKLGDPYGKLTSVGRAWALAELGQTEAARAALVEADEVITAFKFEVYRPSMAQVNGMIAEADGDFDLAVEQFRIARDTAQQDDPMYDVRLGRALRLQGESAEALTVLEAALVAEPARPRAHLELAQVAHEKGQAAKAREHLEIAQKAWSAAHPGFLPAQEARELALRLK